MAATGVGRKRFHSIGAILRHYSVKEYWEKDGNIAIYRFYRFRWFAPHPDGGYIVSGKVTGHVAGCHNVKLDKCGDEP